IKSHHNVGVLQKEMKLKILEQLRYLFKDEVSKLCLGLGLPYNMLYRHPFPVPGLGVRILGEIMKEYVETLQKADAIF
ncbi:GMP synthase (glutamine-hydrolyzing), partial [Francisella tularensis subsp. holarctica]|nr:GMP synthase (glutamine-hydrolyzing) [Francisella tularensis subsp. holarctica]